MNQFKYLISLIICLCTSTVSFANQNAVSRIVNGEAVTKYNFPSFASLNIDTLEFDNGYNVGPFCGAAILNRTHVITAAHCVKGNLSKQMFMTVVPQLENERDYPNGNIERHRVAQIFYPDNFINNAEWLYANDIAILKLEDEMNIDGVTEVVMLPPSESYRNFNSRFVVVGHGTTRSGFDGDSTLLATELKYATDSVCRSVFNYGERLTSSQICFDGNYNAASQLKNSTCQGDSGGPVFWLTDAGEQILVGINSFGPSTCGDPELPVTSVFTEVFDYRSWINSVLNGNELPKVIITEQSRQAYYALNGGVISYDILLDAADLGPESSSGAVNLLSILGFIALVLFRRAHLFIRR